MAQRSSTRPSRITSRVVIALSDSPRLAGFLAQPGGSAFEWFRAIDNRSGDETSRFDVGRFREHFRRDPRAAEIGCTLSHIEVMRRFASMPGAEEDLLLVAEDDARFDDDLDDVLSRLEPHVPRTSLVVLADPYGPRGRRERRTGSKSEHFVQLSAFSCRVAHPRRSGIVTMGRWGAGLTGMGMYLITKSAARLIVRACVVHFDGRPWWAADYHGFYRDHLGVDVLAVRPNLADWDGESSIQDDDHAAWRAGAAEASDRVSVRTFLKERGNRMVRKAKSTKFDLEWRARSWSRLSPPASGRR